MRIGIVGAGPAGSYLALLLARGGLRPVLFHDPSAGEKPCGGGVTAKAFDRFAELRSLEIPRVRIDRARVVSPRGREVRIESHGMFDIFARTEFDGALRGLAVEAGARLVPARARRVGPGPQVGFDGGEETFDFLVGADGARSLVGRATGRPLPTGRLCPSVGVLVKGVDPAEGVWMRFYPGLRGYLWVFPRADRASVGIVAFPGDATAPEMRGRVSAFLREVLPGATVVGSYGWVIPAPGPDGRPLVPVLADRVALLGDAAGIVDPITGEGIYYALVSARILAASILSGRPESYPSLLEEAVAPELARAGAWAERYFRTPVLEAILAGAGRSRRARDLIADLMSGRQTYGGLPERVTSSPAGWLLARVFRTFLAA
ncbi:MAG TPA: NAD(P)/FAD-dependent oxidoreductase [Planctomycetota bacterium]|nr:NAD(P)/FAD-dependent oxidoreductase [Planctomycetota bacterium]